MTAIMWVVGRHKYQADQWHLQGVFDDQQKAIDACRDCTYFIGPVALNQPLPDEQTEWPGCYYPKPEVERL